MLYDAFVCHASEDKDAFVRSLVALLQANHLEIWFDEFALTVGDSIRRAIDLGLTQSRFGIVVLSPAFFEKNWTQYELDGLVERETAGSDRVILPIWFNVDHSEVLRYSPALANKRAALAGKGLPIVVAELLKVMRPQGSPLIVARDTLLGFGVTPPVITDEFWLDVVEASNRVPGYGATIPEQSHWGRWSFPLPDGEGDPSSRGQRLAWTALQLGWTAEADRIPISVTTEWTSVLEFVRRQPGLLETCAAFPQLLVEYAPQLTIPGCEGELESSIEEAYRESLRRTAAINGTNPRFGTALTANGDSPQCEEEWSLRHPNFGGYRSATVADAYFHGGMFGPQVAFHEDADHLIWLVSDRSKWLPERVRDVLLDGLSRCTARWPWHRNGSNDYSWPHVGAVEEALWKFRERKRFDWSPAVTCDWLKRIELAREALGLPESSDDLLDRVRGACIIARWKEADAGLRARHSRSTKGSRQRNKAVQPTSRAKRKAKSRGRSSAARG